MKKRFGFREKTARKIRVQKIREAVFKELVFAQKRLLRTAW